MRIAGLTLLLLVLAAPAHAQAPLPTPTPTITPTPSPEPTAAPHVAIAGVDVGGFTETQVRDAVTGLVRDKARTPVELRSGGRTFTLTTHRARQKMDVEDTVARVMAAPDYSVLNPTLRFRRKPIRKFVARVAEAVFVAPRDATVRIRLTRIGRRPARAGRSLAAKHVVKMIKRRLADPARDRSHRLKLLRTEPEVGGRELRRRYPAIITIQKSTFTLRLFRNLRYDRSYSVAIGQPAYPTPEGLFAIQSKQVNPTWTAPNSPWAGESAGQSYSSSDPNNPLKARWMGVAGSVGIHGTAQDYSIGTAASHGCIRMHSWDVIDLYDRVSIGTPVLIG
jgi:lipoprotein-anchoring transpeptidase ErfK/SrfK